MESVFTLGCELDKIWVSKNALSMISNKYFSNRYTIQEKALDMGIFEKNKDKKAEEQIKIPTWINLLQLKEVLENIAYVEQK